jgi:exodeoxyribonuclease V beta subunit
LLHACGDRALATRLLLTAERQMDEAAIYTIHGFCQRMLKRNAFESGSLFETEFVSDDGRLRFEAVADFWRQHCYGMRSLAGAGDPRHWSEPAALLCRIWLPIWRPRTCAA